MPVQAGPTIRKTPADRMSSSHSEKESDMGRRQEEGGIREDKLGRDANQPEICQESRPIHEVTWTDRPI